MCVLPWKLKPVGGSGVGKSGSTKSVERAVQADGRRPNDGTDPGPGSGPLARPGLSPGPGSGRLSRWRRRALSVTQDLTALTGLVQDAAYRRRYNQAMSTLDQLGKRSPNIDSDELDDLWMLQLRRRR